MKTSWLHQLQRSSLSVGGVLLFFVVFVSLRIILETAVFASDPYFSFATWLFHLLWFSSVAFTLTVWVAVLAHRPWHRIANLAILLTPMIFLPIFVALLTHQPTDFDFIRGSLQEVGREIASLGWAGGGLNAGMGLEIFLIAVGSGIYLARGTRSVASGLIAAMGSLIGVLFFLAEPTFFPFFDQVPSVPLQAMIFAVVLLFGSAALAPTKTFAVIKNLRWERITLFFVFFLISGRISPFASVAEVIFGFAPFFFLWGFAVFLNDVEDEAIDRISNPHRPLILRVLSKREMQLISRTFLLFAVLLTVQQPVLISVIVLLTALLFTLYSLPPFRWRQRLWSLVPLTLAETSPLLLGFFIHRTPIVFTPEMLRLWLGLWVASAMVFGVKDLKDVQGDRHAGVQTWLTVFASPRTGQRVLALLSFFAPIVFVGLVGWTNVTFWVLAVGVGGFSLAYLWFSKRAKESIFFAVYGFLTLFLWIMNF